MQTITRLVGLDETGAVAEILESDPASFIRGARPGPTWLFDPALLDTAGQLAWLWSYLRRGAAALPNRFGRVTRFAGCGPARRMMFAVEQGLPEHEVRADVLVVDDSGRMVLANRSAGKHRRHRPQPICGWAGEIKV